MNSSRIRSILLALLGAALLIIPFFAAAAPATKEFRGDGAAKVKVRTLSGNIVIAGS